MIWIGGLIGSILGKKAGIEEWWENGRGRRVPDREETNRTGFCRFFFFFFFLDRRDFRGRVRNHKCSWKILSVGVVGPAENITSDVSFPRHLDKINQIGGEEELSQARFFFFTGWPKTDLRRAILIKGEFYTSIIFLKRTFFLCYCLKKSYL